MSLLPCSLAEYEAALPDLPREKVLSIFRELETLREEKLATCKEIRREMLKEKRISQERCLSPIAELSGYGDSLR